MVVKTTRKFSMLLPVLLLCFPSVWAEPAVMLPRPLDENAVHRRMGYVFEYSELHEQPLWVAYELTPLEALIEVAERSNYFREDSSIPEGSAEAEDYRGSGYDRGHLAPANAFKWSETVMEQSFYFSNVSPMSRSFNAGIWRRAESFAHNMAEEQGKTLWIISGPLFQWPGVSRGEQQRYIGKNRVWVPPAFFKLIVDSGSPELTSWTFIFPHENNSSPLEDFLVSIDELERMSGLDFLYLLDDELETEIERRK